MTLLLFVHVIFIIAFTLQDAMELDQLISYLINKENSDGVVLLGHSTGCQVWICNPFVLTEPWLLTLGIIR